MLMISENPVKRSSDTWILTFSGEQFWPLNPRAEEIHIEDIAHALSLICRFTGHIHTFYSVADHSLRVSKLAEQMVLEQGRTADHLTMAREIALWGLLHDASEAYLMDVPSPLKRVPGFGDMYRNFEARLMQAVVDRFGLVLTEPAIVKEADRILLNTEMRDLCAPGARYTAHGRLPETIHPLDSRTAEAEFLRRYEALSLAIKAERAANSANQKAVA